MNRLKEARKAKGLTQKEVAEYIGIGQSGYSYWETDRSRINSQSLSRLATLFEVSTDYLLGKEEPTPTNGDGLDYQEKELLALIRDLTPDQKDFLLAQLRTLLGQGQ